MADIHNNHESTISIGGKYISNPMFPNSIELISGSNEVQELIDNLTNIAT